MKMRVLTTKLRVEIENEMRVFLESLNFEIEMRLSQKCAFSGTSLPIVKLWSYTGQLLTAAGPLKKGQACC